MALTAPIQDAIASARNWLESQLAQTERLRPMIGLAAVLVYAALLFSAVGVVSDSARDLRAIQVDLTRLKQQLKDGSWQERKKQSETLKFQLSERFWTAETAGLAEASLERWLRERIEKLGVRPDSIRIQRAAVSTSSDPSARAKLSGVQRMTAKVIMPFEPEALIEVLAASAAFEKILIVDRLLIRSGRNALVELDISTFVVLPESAK